MELQVHELVMPSSRSSCLTLCWNVKSHARKGKASSTLNLGPQENIKLSLYRVDICDFLILASKNVLTHSCVQ